MQRDEYAGPLALRAMQSLAVRAFPVTGYRHIGDLAWSWCLALGRADQCPTAVWSDGGRTLAWGWLELPGGLMLQVDPERPELVHDVLDWAEAAVGTAVGTTAGAAVGAAVGAAAGATVGAAESGPLSVEVAGTEQAVIEALELRGYVRETGGPGPGPATGQGTCPATGPGPDSATGSGTSPATGPYMTCLGRPLTGGLPLLPRLPDGYVIRAQRDYADVAGRAAAHRAAFGSERITAERHARMRAVWPYRPEFDLVVASPGGDIVAYCQGWYDEANRTGVFEPVGTRPDHRRLGLARAVCAAVLHAFARAGGHRAVVQARGDAAYPVPKRLYESLGFAAYARTYTYTRTRTPGPAPVPPGQAPT
ncbi:GNAT family N-acetyltransferase [Streptomyces albofaciens JCM 4342]|uniref:GNAT family N-acetyltransferase n=1 Tax=Streptomyces albofaciens TaxID=66866 RepID=UPI00123A1C05|nr:GNAT family N-acetyltransferase [Streptomyces albofaciens]KAA6214676.1 GNAT family N-acetyltransferase [Streptomyces albofaciens JCM 4342]